MFLPLIFFSIILSDEKSPPQIIPEEVLKHYQIDDSLISTPEPIPKEEKVAEVENTKTQ